MVNFDVEENCSQGTTKTPATLSATRREYYAVMLSVPESGNEEVDEMIRKSNREKAKVELLQSWCTTRHTEQYMLSKVDNLLDKAGL